MRQAQIKYDHVGLAVGTFQRCAAVGPHVDLVAFPPQSPREWLRDRRIILCKKNTGHTVIVRNLARISDRATLVNAFR